MHNLIILHLFLFLSASEELTIAGMTFTTFDLGGHAQGNHSDLSNHEKYYSMVYSVSVTETCKKTLFHRFATLQQEEFGRITYQQ